MSSLPKNHRDSWSYIIQSESSIVTDNHLEHQFFSKISEPVLRTSKQLHLEHQNCSKYALRTSEKQILRTFPLIFCILRTLNTHILRTCPVTLVNLHIYTQIPW